MKKLFALMVILSLSLLTNCTKDYIPGVYCAECIAYREIHKTDSIGNSYIEYEEVHSKEWCDARPIEMNSFFNSYQDSFDYLMLVSENGDYEYCVECKTVPNALITGVEISSCD